MKSVRELPNIGSVVAGELESVGVATEADLRRLGSVRASLLLRANSIGVCACKLYGLEGAIRGIRWHDLPSADRRRLRSELDSFE